MSAAPRTALVTGAAGFIGQGVAGALASGHPGLRVAGLDRARGPEAWDWLVGDVAQARELLAGLPRPPDAVIHCAGITTAACERDPEAAFQVNLEGTRALLAACRALPRAPRFVFTSTIAVFGAGAPVVDEESLVSPRSTYGAVKAAAEQLVLDAARRGEVDGIVARLPITLVRTMRAGAPGAGYLSDLVIAAVEGRPLTAPLAPDRAVPVASSADVFALLADLATVPALPQRRIVQAPAVTGTGAAVVALLLQRGFEPSVTFRPDPAVERLIEGWPIQARSLHLPSMGPSPRLEEIVDRYLASPAPGPAKA